MYLICVILIVLGFALYIRRSVIKSMKNRRHIEIPGAHLLYTICVRGECSLIRRAVIFINFITKSMLKIMSKACDMSINATGTALLPSNDQFNAGILTIKLQDESTI